MKSAVGIERQLNMENKNKIYKIGGFYYEPGTSF